MSNTAAKDEGIATPLLQVVRYKNTRIAVSSALLYIVVLGMLTSYAAPATADMQKAGSRFRGITSNEITWIGSLPNLGCALGNFLSGFLSQKFGRKGVLMFTSSIYLISWLMIVYSNSLALIYVGRFIGGVCAGMCIVAVSAYIVEIAPTEIRGQLATGFQIAYTVGVLLVMGLGIFLRWSWLALSGAAVIACASSIMFFMPESPPWLIGASKMSEAENGLKFLRGKHSDPQRELQIITDHLSHTQEGHMDWSEFFKPEIYKPAGISLYLMLCQQASGISPLLSYTVDIFNSVGSSIDPAISASVVALVQVIGTILSGCLMDKSGRKRLFITSYSVMSVALIALGIFRFAVKQKVDTHLIWSYVPLLCFTVYIFSYSLGCGPIPYVMIPEMVPIKFRSAIIAMAGVWCSVLAFLANKLFDDIRTSLGDYGLYCTFGGLSFLSAVSGYFIIPETKGLTIRQISKSFSDSNNRF